ncbi:MAG: hypothetical protein K9N49_06175 [Candidatus Marinimicrobia bacterium]|nr:hypothetical protein [Candidatus Neomarinimicrobiota bacterium]
MARSFRVEGSKSYLVAAIFLGLLCAWSIWDGWFTPAHFLEKYPDPQDSFYLFNKSMAFLSGIAALVCGYVHFFRK